MEQGLRATALGAMAAVAGLTPAAAGPLPEPIRAMIFQAAESDDPTVLATVLSVARQAAPQSLEQIDAAAAEAGEIRAAARPGQAPPPPDAETLPQAPPVAVAATRQAEWKGAVELGGSREVGSTDARRAYGSMDLSHTAVDWTHRIIAKADYQEADDRKTSERFSLAYQPQVRFSPGFYGFALTQYEHDRFLGLRHRHTVGLGAGLTLLDESALRVAVDAGPAFRATDYYAREQENTLAGRGSLAAKWTPTDRITVSQEAAIYVDAGQTSAKSTTWVETQLFGPLKGRLSYNVQHERDERIDRSDVDTATRASLVYSF